MNLSTTSTATRLAAAQVKAEALTEALPWIKTFAGSTIVIKYGGNAMISPELQQSFADDIAFLRFAGIRPVVVHGGGPQITAMLAKLGIESEFKAGQRVTSEDAAEVIRMVLAGQVNRDIVSRINMNGSAAIGLSGEDADLLLAHKTVAEVDGQTVDLGRVGEIAKVNTTVLRELLDAGRVPVICSIAAEIDGEAGKPLNINADLAASAVAAALGADKLIMLTDVPGLYADWPDTSSLISRIGPDRLRAMLPSLDAGMIPKMTAALEAIEHGVRQAHIVDGRMAHSLLLEVFTSEGIGTMVEDSVVEPAPLGDGHRGEDSGAEAAAGSGADAGSGGGSVGGSGGGAGGGSVGGSAQRDGKDEA